MCLCLGLHDISHLLLGIEYDGTKCTKGNMEIAMKANENRGKGGMKTGEKEELKQYLLKSGSVFITSLKNTAACEAKQSVNGLACSSATFTSNLRQVCRLTAL